MFTVPQEPKTICEVPRIISQHLDARETIQDGEDNLTGSARLTEYRVSTDTKRQWINTSWDGQPFLASRSCLYSVLRQPQSCESSVRKARQETDPIFPAKAPGPTVYHCRTKRYHMRACTSLCPFGYRRAAPPERGGGSACISNYICPQEVPVM